MSPRPARRRSPPTRTPLAWLAALALLAACGDPGPSARPSVLVITLDTLRADRLETYLEDGRDVMPRLDAFARECVVFERATANSSFTPPSHASILTGLFPEEHGLTHWSRRLADVPTAASLYGAAGYRTLAVSPLRTLFTIGLDAGFDDAVELPHREGDGLLWLADAAEVNAAALPWIGNLSDRPFFAWLHYYDAHRVYGRQGPEWARRYNDHPDLDVGGTEAWYQLDARDRQRLGIDDDKTRFIKDRYDGGVAFLDEHIGKLLQGLRDSGRLDDMIVVVTADHGEVLDEHGEEWFSHDPHLVQENLHVPLLVRLPGGAHAGRRVDALVQGVDLLPTLLELTGVDAGGASFSGLSLVGLLGDEPDGDRVLQGRPFVYASRRGRDATDPGASPDLMALTRDRRRMLRSHGHKLVHYVDRESFALFALPDESRDVLSLKPDVTGQLKDAYLQLMAGMTLPPGDGGATLDPQTREMLCALGYIDDCD